MGQIPFLLFANTESVVSPKENQWWKNRQLAGLLFFLSEFRNNNNNKYVNTAQFTSIFNEFSFQTI